MLVCLFIILGVLTQVPAGQPESDPRALSSGTATTFDRTREAFGQPLANLPSSNLRRFAMGNRIFKTRWVSAPASVTQFDGLGPLFNRSSCSGCHLRDGRGRPPTEQDDSRNSMLVRIGIPGSGPHGTQRPHAAYGGQIQDRAVHGIAPEGRIAMDEEERAGRFVDGQPYALRRLRYRLEDPAYGPTADGRLSPRIAPAIPGLGLLEAVGQDAILEHADEGDADADGISGRPNWVWDHARQTLALGRFGWKAGQPSIKQQNAVALQQDIGITSTLFPRENIGAAQSLAREVAHGGQPEISDEALDTLTFYVRTLAIPARRDVDDPLIQHGERLFDDIGCTACHRPTLHTAPDTAIPELAHQTIHPYTDLLLHDMGDDLADDLEEFVARGREWRTAPLWGIGLTRTVSDHAYFLHDGRARSLAEAILWHGGEGSRARDGFIGLSAGERAALIRFLESL